MIKSGAAARNCRAEQQPVIGRQLELPGRLVAQGGAAVPVAAREQPFGALH